MAKKGQGAEIPEAVLDAVAASLLLPGADTRAARVFRGLSADLQVPGRAAATLAGRIGLAPIEQARRVATARERARRACADAREHDIAIVPWFAPEYPALLWQIVDPPIVLWVAGDPRVLAESSVAVVGSRAGTPASLQLARRLASELARSGLVVVSGLARGVDGAAHSGALDACARTVGVLGCGADVVYPKEHAALTGRVRESGAIVSELPPGTEPRPPHFPLRNRIISGLSLGVVVIEAGEKSGSLITARMALEQGRDVLAVPGSVVSGRSRGCHALIKDGARLVETVEDVWEEIGWQVARGASRLLGAGSAGQVAGETSPLEGLMALGETCLVDDLAARTGRSVADLLAELGELEIAGRITRMAGGGFARLDGTGTVGDIG